MSELNPNNAVLHAIVALMVAKQGGHVVITMDDIHNTPDGLFLTVQELDDGVHFRLVDEATANALAKQHGGLPT